MNKERVSIWHNQGKKRFQFFDVIGKPSFFMITMSAANTVTVDLTDENNFVKYI